MFDATLDRR